MEFRADRFRSTVQTKIIVMKIKLKKRLWNTEKDSVMEVDKNKAEFAIRKGYAEKADPEVKKRKTKVDPMTSKKDK